ncbi:MAG TPA: ATP-dependent helicase [Aquificaceae bacterium]|nr:ATP-dependent helicase [Aquificaceae bacterium]
MLNPQQEKVVKHYGKPLLVVAGAGSGKTKTLAHKVEFLLTERGLSREGILCITFTSKAAREIRERVLKVCGADLPWAGTFHSVAYRILREKLGRRFAIADEKDVEEIIRATLEKLGVRKDRAEGVRKFIQRVKEDLTQISSPELIELFETYQRTLRENGLFDFSDLLYELYIHLLKDESLRESLKDTFEFILVDEYQDTNTVQYEVIKMLANKDVCVVGDPNQCIYEWRFARPDNVLRFIEDFKPDVVRLETNYRSGGYILEVANSLLLNSSARWRELVPTLRAVKGMGEKPIVRRFEDPQEEALWIGKEIKNLLTYLQPSQIAVLVRVSFITDLLERTFFKMGIPYKVVGALRFYERYEVKTLLHFLRLLETPADGVAFRRTLPALVSGVGEGMLRKVRENFIGNWVEALKRTVESLPQRMGAPLRSFMELYGEATELPYPDALKKVVEESFYLEHLRRKYREDFGERLENVKELIETAEESFKEGVSLGDFLSEAFLVSSEEEGKEAVSVMTIHSAKGLEFSAVFLPRLEEGILPHRSALEGEEELEEERRLFYVAITRAKDRLFISYTKGKERKASRFLSEIPKRLLNLEYFRKRKTHYSVELKANPSVRSGVLVRHKVFGVGKVIKVDGEKAQVDFGGKVKNIHTHFLQTLD